MPRCGSIKERGIPLAITDGHRYECGHQQPPLTTMSSSEQGANQPAATEGWFKTTHWSVVLAAGAAPHRSDALAKLCQVYWPPIYSYTRKLGHGPEDAEDLTQEFFFRLMEKDYLKSLDRETGKFRSWLLVVLKRFLANEWDRANCQKRGGGREILSLDAQDTELGYLAEPVDARTPDQAFDRRWALAVLEQVTRRLRTEMADDGRAELFDGLKDFLGGESGASYAEAAVRMHTSEGALRVAVHRMRHRYREILREEIASTVASTEEVEEEIRHLFLSLT